MDNRILHNQKNKANRDCNAKQKCPLSPMTFSMVNQLQIVVAGMIHLAPAYELGMKF
jgi:hypothetical protein